MNEKEKKTRSGFVALVGAPNCGKSTLINQLVGAKISVVTHKVQTTRTLVRGIVMHQDAQIILVDMPGIFQPKKRLDRAMVSAAWGGARDADYVLFLVDAKVGMTDDVVTILKGLKTLSKPVWLLLNKIDIINPTTLLALSAEFNEQMTFEHSFMISARTGSGCMDVLDQLAKCLPQGPYYYPEDQISDMPMRQLAAEITREKLYLRLHDEIPYKTTVETEHWEERKDGSVRIDQLIFVEKDSQKRIILGHKGATIKAIGQAARREITEILEKNVHLFLFVKVRDDWGNDPERYRAINLEFSK